MPDDLKQKVKRFIRDHALLRGGEHVLVAVSGGADSVALLSVLRELTHQYRLRLTVAHLNHKIRGKDAGQDACFVKQLARRLQLDFALGNVAVPRLAGRLGISLEMAGRKARYKFFEKTALARGCHLVATAHTAHDNAETILLMLARGCGLPGLAGIPLRCRIGKITVVRPLLGTDRRAIEKYLRARKISWRADASNADDAFLRNRVRHELLPLLEEKYNKGIRVTLNRMSGVLREENDFMDQFAEKVYSTVVSKSLADRKTTHIPDSRLRGNDRMGICACHSRLARASSIRPGTDLNARQLTKYHVAVRRRVLRRWLLANGIDSETVNFQLINRIDKIIKTNRGGQVCLAGRLLVKKNYQWLTMDRMRASPRRHYLFDGAEGSRPTFRKSLTIKIKIPGTTVLPGSGLCVKAKIGPGVDRARVVFGKFPVRASMSLKKWKRRRILARPWRPGDRMRPYGLDGSKKIQDIFSDAKFPAVLRRRLPIFECGGEVIWIPGYRIAEGWQVMDSADNALQLTVDWA